MAARPSWEGHLRLSLVTCPVALWPATSEAETVRFNMINPKTNNRIRMQTIDAGTGEEVSRSELVKGFQVAKGEYVLFDKEELDAVKLESTRIIDIEKFVPRASIDRLYWDTPYHLVPSGKTGIEAYAVIRAAMAKQNMVAIGRLVMSTRERICAIEIEEGGLVLTTLRTAEEVRAIDQIALPDLPKPDPKMLQIAEKIVEQQSGDFDPSEFRDRYEDALRALIEDKRKGRPVKPQKPANDDKVVDLMAALKKSLEGGAAGAPRQRAERFVAAKDKPRKSGGRTRAA
jgi:DNA end-binding protein Ku